MEQVASLRAEAEVEKALMLKRSSIDDRRPSYVLRVLEDLAEVEEGINIYDKAKSFKRRIQIFLRECSG
jgi:hypothetical protein